MEFFEQNLSSYEEDPTLKEELDHPFYDEFFEQRRVLPLIRPEDIEIHSLLKQKLIFLEKFRTHIQNPLPNALEQERHFVLQFESLGWKTELVHYEFKSVLQISKKLGELNMTLYMQPKRLVRKEFKPEVAK